MGTEKSRGTTRTTTIRESPEPGTPCGNRGAVIVRTDPCVIYDPDAERNENFPRAMKAEDAEKYKGEWIGVAEGGVVAHGKEYTRVYEDACKEDKGEPFMHYVGPTKKKTRSSWALDGVVPLQSLKASARRKKTRRTRLLIGTTAADPVVVWKTFRYLPVRVPAEGGGLTPAMLPALGARTRLHDRTPWAAGTAKVHTLGVIDSGACATAVPMRMLGKLGIARGGGVAGIRIQRIRVPPRI